MSAALLTGAASFLFGRSRRFRWLVPAVPLALAAYRYLKTQRESAALVAAPPATRVAPLGARVAPLGARVAPQVSEPAAPIAPKRRKRATARPAARARQR